jgi:CRISPR-associated endoribonuclease Cas6
MELDMEQPHPDNLYAIAIQLKACDHGSLPATLSRAIHAQVLQWLSIGNLELANTVHSSQESPISISGLIGRRDKIRPGDEFTIRIGLLDGQLLEPLFAGITQWGTKPLQLTGFPFVIQEICSMPGSHPLVGASQYSMLSTMSVSSDDMTLQFCTPTSFKQAQTIQPFPLPDLVFGNLQRRWNAFAPESLRFQALTWEGIVSSYELKTYALKMEGGAEVGCQGWARYRFKQPEQARIATILANFAFFSGVGRKTAMGMGQTRLSSPANLSQRQSRKQ